MPDRWEKHVRVQLINQTRAMKTEDGKSIKFKVDTINAGKPFAPRYTTHKNGEASRDNIVFNLERGNYYKDSFKSEHLKGFISHVAKINQG
jgi:hypothetical protein